MILSMTGFGRAAEVNNEYKLTIEVKAVNHRYLDLSIKMPRRFNVFENKIRKFTGEYIGRGKVDMYISFEDYTKRLTTLHYNKGIAKEYYDIARLMQEDFSLTNDIKASNLIRLPEVVTMEENEEDDNTLWSIVEPVLKKALLSFNSQRQAEGETLKKDLIEKLDYMYTQTLEIEKRAPKLIDEYKEKLEQKVSELLEGAAIDENRILAEVKIYDDKICNDEEIVRLKSHIKAVETELIVGGVVGRKLDFLAQEMNREANTVLSKSTNLEIADKAIGIKAEIEKVREQIQNIE